LKRASDAAPVPNPGGLRDIISHLHLLGPAMIHPERASVLAIRDAG